MTLAPTCNAYSIAQEAVLFTEGRAATNLYVVTDGELSLRKSMHVTRASRTNRVTITICQPGDVVGWSALVSPYRYTLSAMAWEDSRLIRVEGKMLRKAFQMYPDIGCKVMTALSAVISRRLVQTTEALLRQLDLMMSGNELSVAI